MKKKQKIFDNFTDKNVATIYMDYNFDERLITIFVKGGDNIIILKQEQMPNWFTREYIPKDVPEAHNQSVSQPEEIKTATGSQMEIETNRAIEKWNKNEKKKKDITAKGMLDNGYTLHYVRGNAEKWKELEVSLPRGTLEGWYGLLYGMDRTSEEEYILVKVTEFDRLMRLLSLNGDQNEKHS